MIRDSNRSRRTYPVVRKRARASTTTSATLSRITMNTSFCERSSDTALFYAPWGSLAEGTAGDIDEEAIWLPPFGDNTTITSVLLYTQTAAGSTTVTIRDVDQNILATQTVDMSSARTMYEFELDYAIVTNEPLIIGIDPTTAVNSVRTQIIAEETVAGASNGSGQVVSSISYCSTGSSTSLFYLPWGNFAEGSAGGVDEEVTWMPPFGTSTRILSLLAYTENAPGSTTVTIRDFDENILATQTVNMSSAQTIYEFEFDYQLLVNEPIIIGFGPTTALQEMKAVLLAEQVT